MALDPRLFEDITNRLAEIIPAGARDLQTDMERNLRAMLSSSLEKLSLVTREEFEVQQAVLARTRSQLEGLAARITKLEAQEQTRSD